MKRNFCVMEKKKTHPNKKRPALIDFKAAVLYSSSGQAYFGFAVWSFSSWSENNIGGV